jgi:hypothetical protein
MTLSFGRRTVLLIMLGLTDITYGAALLVADRSGTSNRWWTTARWWPAAQGELLHLDIRWWGVIWVTIGFALLTSMLYRSDRHLFAAEMALKSVWGLGALHWALTTSSPGLWGPAATYVGMSMIVLLCAGWTEAPSVSPVRAVVFDEVADRS